ncbi:MAG: hypothetical protein C0403_19400 [Desulfobacterium sp.]|nr:hypothetical protein [Desulfobacterium sp.]
MKKIITSLGYPLQQTEEGWEIDLSELNIFTGLSVLAKIIGEHIIDEVERSPGDVSFLYKVNSNINPELVKMKIHHIQVYARAGVLDDSRKFRDIFINQLITVFGSLQQPKWRREIYPDAENCQGKNTAQSKALIFPFSHEYYGTGNSNRFILEKVKNPVSEASYFFRLTIETIEKETIDLKTIPNMVVDDLLTRVYIAGSSKIARSVRDNIVNACSRGIDYYSEENRIYSRLFEQLENTHLGRLEYINFSWNESFSNHIRKELPEGSLSIFKKIFLSLEAYSICEILHNGGTIKVILHDCFFCLYLSQLGRSLNISINMPRKMFHMDDYLKRMPMLSSIAKQMDHHFNFSNTKIFLIHHITSEIIGFIAALKKLGAYSIDVMFVKYSGIIPPVYLDTLLETDSDYLFMAGLEKKTSGKVTDYYTIADYFSDASGLSELNELLKNKKYSYFDAMKIVSGHLFLNCCIDAKKQGKKVLLIEDGGYIAPFLNESGLSEKKTDELFDQFGFPSTDKNTTPFQQWLNDVLIGTVEHTKNGYDRLYAVKQEHANLLFPSFSIAISKLKTDEESQEVAHSILSAIESILHENGLVLSRRNIIILGAEGNIGKPLCRLLKEGRLHQQNQTLTQVDLQYNLSGERKYCTLEKVPDDELYQKDLFIGVIGKSVLKKEQIEKLILFGEKTNLFFASGSTKTVEFEDLSTWLQMLSEADKPVIGDKSVEIEYSRIYDPQSGFDQGRKVMIRFQQDNHLLTKQLFLLADLSPINFLYYGVPTEIMDAILSQLLKVSLGMNHQYFLKTLPSPDLYAVDHQIDEWGNKI